MTEQTNPRKSSSLDRARRGGRASRDKGARAEIQVRDMIRDHGWTTAHRQFQSGGQGGGDLAEAIPDFHIEVKRTEAVSLPAWWRQASKDARATDTVLIIHRGSQQPWQATGLLTDLLPLVSMWLPVTARVVGRSFRPEFLADVKAATPYRRPCVVHQCGADAMCTVLFEDLLSALVQQRDGKAAA